MAKIPGWAYIIIGVAVSVFSKIVNNNMGDNSLALFYYVGFLFILIGIGKTIVTLIKKKTDKTIKGDDKEKTHVIGGKKHPQHHQTQQQTHHQQHAHHQTQHRQHPQQYQRNYSQQQHQQVRQPMQQMHGNNHHINKTQHDTNIQHQSIIMCPRCGTKHYANASYCSKCGIRLR